MLFHKAKLFSKSNLFKYMSVEFLNVITGFLISTYILVYLGAKDLGQFTLYMMLIALFSTLSQGSGNSYLMKNFFKQDQNRTIASVNLTMAIFSLVALMIYLSTESFFSEYYYTSYFILFAILKAYNSTTFVVMRLKEDADSFFIWSIMYKSLYALPVLYLIIQKKFTIENFVLILFINEIIFLILLYAYLYFKYKYSFVYDRSFWKGNIALSSKLFPHKVFKTIYDNIDKYAVQLLLGLEALGIYSMITRLASPIAIFIKSANNELSVVMSKVHSNKGSEVLIRNLEKKIYLLLIPVNLGTIILSYACHIYIYHFENNFFEILFLVLLYKNLLILYYVFYNENFYLDRRLIYFIRFFSMLLISTTLLTTGLNKIEDILFVIIGVELSMLILLFLNAYKSSKLVISKYILLINIVLFIFMI